MNKIGVMLDEKVISLVLRGKQTYERLGYYAEIGESLGLVPVFFHPRHVNLRTRQVRGYQWRNNRLTRRTTSIPRVIHNRVLTGNPATNAMIRALGRVAKVYNGIVVRNKGRVYQLLKQNHDLRRYLPNTGRYSQTDFLRFLQRYPIVYVKPTVGSVGKGVARIERHADKYLFVSNKGQRLLGQPALLREMGRWVNGRRFLVQQGVKLATYKGQTFDIRVSVQKNGKRLWTVSGMVAKVANPHNKLSNLAQGGKAVPIGNVLGHLFDQQKAGEVRERIEQAAIAIAKELNRYNSSLADLGLDMGIDEAGNPYLIEVNVRDQRYSFYKAGEIEMFKRTYRTPLEYGKSFFA